jgi:hypothetical protein
MTTYTLPSQAQGFVVIVDKVHDAKVVGITSDERLVVIFDNGVSIEFAKSKRHSATNSMRKRRRTVGSLIES